MNSKFPIVAGVFEIIFACICMFLSSVFLLIITSSLASDPLYGVIFPEYVYLLVFAVYGFVVFICGLMGGIFALKRTRFALALVGVCFIMCWGILFAWLTVSRVRPYGPISLSDPWSQGIIIGTTTVMFSTLSLAFLLSSRTEFT